MVSITAHAEADDLGVDFRAAFFCVLVLFQHHHARAVAQHEAVAIFIPRTACRLRVVIARGERPRCAKAAHAKRGTGFFRTACHHRIGIAIGDDARSLTDVVHA